MDSDMEFSIVVVVAIAACLGTFLKRHGEKLSQDYYTFMSFPWMKIGLILLSLVTIVLVSWFVIKWHKNYKEKKEIEEHNRQIRRNEMKRLLHQEFHCSSDKVSPRFKQIKKELEKYPSELLREFEDQITTLENQLPKIIKNKKEEERDQLKKTIEGQKRQKNQEKIEQYQKQQRKEIFEKQVQELFAFKKRHNSFLANPLKKFYDKDVIREASWRMREFMNKQNESREIRDKAIRYYEENSIESEPHLANKKEKEIFAQVRKDIKKNKLQLNKLGNLNYKGPTLEKVFYRARELTKEEKLRAKQQGFEYIRGNELDGYVSGGFYIQRNDSTETPFHFYMKYLFKELHENMYIEHSVAGKRADIALLIKGFKLAIEIETGKNRMQYIQEKVSWLKDNFDQWIIVCKKDLLPRYSQFVDNQDSFCFTPKEAQEHIKKITFHH
ncbi:hypothetical protein ACFL0V_05720 [Nanoarchaeota archaeon]